MTYRMKMLSGHRRQLQKLLKDTSAEQACFLLCSYGVGDDTTTLVVEEVLPLKPSDLARQGYDILSVGHDAMMRIANTARQRQLSVCMVHTHPMSQGEVGFSHADDVGNVKTFEFFNNMAKQQLHSCLVFSGDLEHVAGRVYPAGHDWQPIEFVEITDSSINLRLHDHTPAEDDDVAKTYSRQTLLLGKLGQKVVSRLRIGLIGAGGLGSVAAMLLSHSGICELRVFDHDIVEEHNRPRLIACTPDDATAHTPKVEVIRRYVQTVRPDCVVKSFQSRVEDSAMLPYLLDLDAIVIASDGATSRKYVNDLCQQRLIPVLDMGVQFIPEAKTGEIEKEFLKVHLCLPRHACIGCIGHIHPSHLAAEAMPADMRAQQIKEGYVRGMGQPEPSMMMFNASVAARGVQVLLGYFTGLIPSTQEHYETLELIGVASGRPVVRLWKKERDPNCPHCSHNWQATTT